MILVPAEVEKNIKNATEQTKKNNNLMLNK
jgi:hypothetical protein